MEETKWLFDEFLQVVFNKLPTQFKGVQQYIGEQYGGIIEDDVWEMWYYYINGPVARFVSNYYTLYKYDPKTFEKNIFKAVDNFGRTKKEQLVKNTRNMMIDLSDVSETVNILDENGNRYKIYFVWYAEPDACDECKRLDGTILKSKTDFQTHWNCRCHLEEHVTIISPDGKVLNEIVKIL